MPDKAETEQITPALSLGTGVPRFDVSSYLQVTKPLYILPPLKPPAITYQKPPADFVRLAATIYEFSKALDIAVPSVALVFETAHEMHRFIAKLALDPAFAFQTFPGIDSNEVFEVHGVKFLISTTEKS